MATSQQILREYLISLGYKVDNASAKRFDTSIFRTRANVAGLATSVLGLIASTQAFVAVWARSMERAYYDSKLAKSTAGNLAALNFGARSIGISGETIESAVKGIARAMRLNPGLKGLVESFGIQVTGRDMADVANDFIRVLSKMPFYKAAQYAGLFGIDPDTLLLWEEGLDKLTQASARRKEMAEAAGLDVDAAAKAGLEYSNQVREIGELLGIMKDVAAVNLLPPFLEVAGVVKEILKDWTKIIKVETDPNVSHDRVDFFRRIAEGLGLIPRKGVELSPRTKVLSRVHGLTGEGVPKAGGTDWTDAVAGDPEAMLNALEVMYGLPAGLLDKIWNRESARGTYMESPAGALGHFGFMPGTAKQYGLNDPNNLMESGTAAARYMRDLLKKYKGNEQLALAAYNWGPGNVDRYGLNSIITPAETLSYVSAVSGRPVTFQMSNDIKVVSPDPQAAGQAVGREQKRVGADLVRAAGVVE